MIKPALQLADLALQILDLCIVILDLSGQRCVQRIVVALRIIHSLLCLLRFLPQLAPLRVQLIELAFQFASGLFIRCRIIGILHRCDLIAERAQTSLIVAVFVCGACLIVSRLCLRELRIRIIDPALIAGDLVLISADLAVDLRDLPVIVRARRRRIALLIIIASGLIIRVLQCVIRLIDSVLRAIRSSFNLGVLMMYLITAALWIYALFHTKIDAFCAAGAGRVLKIIFFCCCAVFALLLIFVAVSGYSDTATKQEKAVIVLGAGLRGERVTDLLARRLDAAYDYHLENPNAVIVVTGGQGPGEDIPEARAMKAYLVEKGVPEKQIVEEASSTSTEENFCFAREILEQHGLSQDEPVAYVTNAFHCYRAAKYAAAAGFTNVNAIPASIGFSSVLPCYMREVMAVLYYWVFRT